MFVFVHAVCWTTKCMLNKFTSQFYDFIISRSVMFYFLSLFQTFDWKSLFALNVKWCWKRNSTSKLEFSFVQSVLFLHKEMPQSKSTWAQTKRWHFFLVSFAFCVHKYSFFFTKYSLVKQTTKSCLLRRLIPLKCEMHQFVWRSIARFFFAWFQLYRRYTQQIYGVYCAEWKKTLSVNLELYAADRLSSATVIMPISMLQNEIWCATNSNESKKRIRNEKIPNRRSEETRRKKV